MKRIVLSVVVLVSVLLFNATSPKTEADGSYFDLSGGSFSQDWTKTTLITLDDNWSGVFNVQGFRGDSLTGGTGTDPQTLTLDDATPVLDVIANQSNPNTNTNGGIVEFDGIANPTVAFQGSATADAPYVQLHMDTTGRHSVQVSYNLRDIDGSTDNAVQPVALQYRVGTSGTFTNVPAGFAADATTGPSLATLVTPVSATLPAAVDNQSLVQIRIMTANAVGTDEWVGIDDIAVASAPIPAGDTTAPLITYSSFGTTGSMANRVLSVTILDDVNVASGAVAPRIYFRKNAGAYFSTQCVLTSGDTQAGVYDCTVDNSLMGGVAPGDIIGYFVIAQDTSGNVASNPSGVVAANVNTVTTPPTANTYMLLQTFSGSVSVGTDQTIQSLTNNGGLFQQMNAGTISGNTVVNLTTDLTAETGTHSLNQQIEEGAGNWTILFQASGGPRLISGLIDSMQPVNSALIKINGADRVTFSGLALGPNGLTIRLLGFGAAIEMTADASNNSVLNCAVQASGGISAAPVVISIAGLNNSIIGNSLATGGPPGQAVAGLIRLSGDSNTLIANNELVGGRDFGIDLNGSEDTIIEGNSILGFSSLGASMSGEGPITFRGNTVIGLGIGVRVSSGDTLVERNAVRRSFGGGVGMLASAPVGSIITIRNNMVAMTACQPSPGCSNTIGILEGGAAGGTVNLEYNSVLISGSASVSWAYRRDDSIQSNSILTGNIFFNDVPSVFSYAARDGSPNAGTFTSNYNIFVGTGSTPHNYFQSGNTSIDFSAWQAGPPARDANSFASIAGAGPFNVGNMFVSTADLHLKVSANNPAINAGTGTSVTTDFDGQARPFNGIPDIGADEVQTVPTAAEVSLSGRVTNTNGQGIRNIRVVISGGSLVEPRLATTGSFGYFRFDGLEVGNTYVVTVSGKRFVFLNPSRVVSLVDELADVDFVGRPR